MSTQSLFDGNPQAGFAFPQALTEKHRPRTIDSFVGLDKVKNVMRKLASNPFPRGIIYISR